MKKGDLVKITDVSYSVRLDEYEGFENINSCGDVFKVVEVDHAYSHLRHKLFSDKIMHDIIIKNTLNGGMYLHSSTYVKPFKSKTVTVECEGHTKTISRQSAKEFNLIP